MIQLNWYKIFGESHQIPDGRTVTPTDDIQIWLHCADIWDKTYTTLTEVLADTSTLVMLMAIDNAVDYLVRSTTWATAQALVPTMTDNTHPSGVCSAISERYPAYYAFNNENVNTWWESSSNATTSTYLQYEFPTKQKIGKASVIYYYVNASDPRLKKYKYQVSDDGNTWTDASSEITAKTVVGYNTDETVLSVEGKYIRLQYTEGFANTAGIFALQFYSEVITTSEIAMKSIGASDYASTTLLADSTWNSAIHGSPYSSYVENVSVPTMTSNNTPSGTCSGSTVHSATYDYWKAFDGSADSNWSSSNGNTTNQYLRYVFDYSVTIYKAVIQNRNDSNNFYVKNCKIQYSADGITYLDDVSFTNPSGQAVSTTVMLSGVSGVGFGVFAIDNYGGNYSQIGELQFYGREIGGVQTWLRSANITDKTYTTLAEVLADSTTLSALMSNHNAVDYLVTAKGWADDICADSSAMTYIGLNNYASNTLLADSTWCEAILNSTYVESVMNVKIPVMTSSTQPYGECFAGSSYADYPAWKAFNGDANTFWNSNSTSANGVWVGYKFVSKSKIRGYKILSGSTFNSYAATGVSFKIQGSDDSFVGDIHDLDTQSGLNFSDYKPKAFAFSGEENYTQFRVLYSAITTPTTYKGVTSILQFYGREDI